MSLSSGYHPQPNGQVEWANQDLRAALVVSPLGIPPLGAPIWPELNTLYQVQPQVWPHLSVLWVTSHLSFQLRRLTYSYPK